MKLDRLKFSQAVETFRSLEQTPFDEIDFSEFFDINDPDVQTWKRDWDLLGLSKRDFLLMRTDLWKQF